MKANKYAPCPCYSGDTYSKCCYPFHHGDAAPTAVALMRSRFCAYALGMSEYIIQTTHPDNQLFQKDTAAWLRDIDDFASKTRFAGLSIDDHWQDGDEATVSFTADLKQGHKAVGFSEKSTFARTDGKWLYRSGTAS